MQRRVSEIVRLISPSSVMSDYNNYYYKQLINTQRYKNWHSAPCRLYNYSNSASDVVGSSQCMRELSVYIDN